MEERSRVEVFEDDALVADIPGFDIGRGKAVMCWSGT